MIFFAIRQKDQWCLPKGGIASLVPWAPRLGPETLSWQHLLELVLLTGQMLQTLPEETAVLRWSLLMVEFFAVLEGEGQQEQNTKHQN